VFAACVCDLLRASRSQQNQTTPNMALLDVQQPVFGRKEPKKTQKKQTRDKSRKCGDVRHDNDKPFCLCQHSLAWQKQQQTTTNTKKQHTRENEAKQGRRCKCFTNETPNLLFFCSSFVCVCGVVVVCVALQCDHFVFVCLCLFV